MNNTVNFTSKSNAYFAITKKGWNCPIPNKAYEQINQNRNTLEKFARKNNIKITFTDARNMQTEHHSANETNLLSNKLAIEIEKMPTLADKFLTAFSQFKSKISGEKNTPKAIITSVSYYSKDSKKLPNIKEKEKIGLFIDYELGSDKFKDSININSVIDLLQKVVGKTVK